MTYSTPYFSCILTLLGLTFLHTIAHMHAKPIVITIPTHCANVSVNTPCCPPTTSKVKHFVPPKPTHKPRIRRPAHKLDHEYIQKYYKAVQLMKALPPNDPRSYTQQASAHCAYCDGAYRQRNNSQMEIQIHSSWLFFPFHRFYIYFYERILGSLINDPHFALPFWNWDSPESMSIPAIFANESSPLYNPRRNPNHLPPGVVNLNYEFEGESNLTSSELVKANLAIMYRAMQENLTERLFFGEAYRLGSYAGHGSGLVEEIPHNSVHLWVGQKGDNEDMGNFYSSARDPLFFTHHANVDRLWTLRSHKKKHVIDDPDFLEASFIFYDEKGEAVRVKVKDALETKDLGYVYEKVDNHWVHAKPKPRNPKSPRVSLQTINSEKPVFPVSLHEVFSARIERNAKAMKNDGVLEILTIEGIECRRDVPAKFDVYVNAVDWAEITPADSEFAGSFVNVPNTRKRGMVTKRSLRLAISELLKDVGAEDDESLTVTLVPRFGKEHIKIDGVGISFQSL